MVRWYGEREKRLTRKRSRLGTAAVRLSAKELSKTFDNSEFAIVTDL